MNYEVIRLRMISLLKEQNKSIGNMAKELGFTTQGLKKSFDNGKPRIDILENIANYLGVDFKTFLFGDDTIISSKKTKTPTVHSIPKQFLEQRVDELEKRLNKLEMK